MTETEPRVIQLVKNEVGSFVTDVKPEHSLSGDLGLDSLDHVALIINLEEMFSVEISDPESDKLKTVQDIIKLINTKKGETSEG